MYSKTSINLADAIAKLSKEHRSQIARIILSMNEDISYSGQDFDRSQQLGSALKICCDAVETNLRMKIIGIDGGKIRKGFKGTAIFESTKTVYLGENFIKTHIPQYRVKIDGSSGIFVNCQAGRDFDFIPD